MRPGILIPAALTMLMVSCTHPVRPSAGEPVRAALALAKTRSAEVVRHVAANSPEAALAVSELQSDLAAAQVAFDGFEARYTAATAKISLLDAKVITLSASRNFWRGITFAAAGTIVLCLALLIIPRLP